MVNTPLLTLASLYQAVTMIPTLVRSIIIITLIIVILYLLSFLFHIVSLVIGPVILVFLGYLAWRAIESGFFG